MRKSIFFLPLLFLTVFAIGCGSTQAEKTEYGRARDFEARDLNGTTLILSEYAGKVIILNFFATWCPPCKAEMPDFNEIAREYKLQAEVIAVNVGREDVRKVRNFVTRNQLTFHVIMDDGKISNLYGPIRAIPVTVVIDRDFNIARRYVGMRTKDVFINDIKELK